jgi:hypothetical protein
MKETGETLAEHLLREWEGYAAENSARGRRIARELSYLRPLLKKIIRDAARKKARKPTRPKTEPGETQR